MTGIAFATHTIARPTTPAMPDCEKNVLRLLAAVTVLARACNLPAYRFNFEEAQVTLDELIECLGFNATVMCNRASDTVAIADLDTAQDAVKNAGIALARIAEIVKGSVA